LTHGAPAPAPARTKPGPVRALARAPLARVRAAVPTPPARVRRRTDTGRSRPPRYRHRPLASAAVPTPAGRVRQQVLNAPRPFPLDRAAVQPLTLRMEVPPPPLVLIGHAASLTPY
jgi:hypothetical protein